MAAVMEHRRDRTCAVMMSLFLFHNLALGNAGSSNMALSERLALNLSAKIINNTAIMIMWTSDALANSANISYTLTYSVVNNRCNYPNDSHESRIILQIPAGDNMVSYQHTILVEEDSNYTISLTAQNMPSI